jgi:hypothetical protein
MYLPAGISTRSFNPAQGAKQGLLKNGCTSKRAAYAILYSPTGTDQPFNEKFPIKTDCNAFLS